MIISDEGKNYDSLLRKMRRHNFIPSRYGDWGNGTSAKNIPVVNVLEDIVYRDSAKSYFVQAADFCAFSLLRYEYPTSKSKQYGFDKSFDILEPICVKQAYSGDPKRRGIIRG